MTYNYKANYLMICILILRIGVNGFENPLRDAKTEEFKKQIGSGCKLKMDDTGMDDTQNEPQR